MSGEIRHPNSSPRGKLGSDPDFSASGFPVLGSMNRRCDYSLWLFPDLYSGFIAAGSMRRKHFVEARKQHFRRSAVVHRAEDGRLKFAPGVLPSRRAALGIGCVLVLTLLAGILGVDRRALVLLGLAGFLAGWFGFLWLGFGLRKKLLRDYARFVLPGEGLVIIEETQGRTTDAIAVLRSIGNPSVFVIRPGLRLAASTETDDTREAVTLGGLPNCAAELAVSHQLDPSFKSRSLLPILRDCEIGIERARADLGEATRLDYGITHAAEWLLDNTYLIRSHIADIRHNLPDNHNKILPVIADTNSPVRLRIYHLADDLICRTGYRVTPESIVSFLNGYQQQAPLTIAELWVFPLMLRLVLLQRLQRLSELTSLRQHQKEMADFWANRLLNAAQRGPEQFDRIVAELDRDGNELTPHFIARLGEQLHKEESALAPIQKWIEAKTGFHLADIILREHAEEANDLMFIIDRDRKFAAAL